MKKQKKSSKESTTNYKAVFSYLRYTYKQFPKSGLIALISRVVSTAVFVIPPIFYKQIIDILSSTGITTSELSTHAIGVLLIILWIQLGTFVIFRIYDYFAITFEMDMQEWLNNTFLKYLQGHSFQFFSDNFTGSLISKFRKGVTAFERLTDILAREIIPFVVNILLILVIIGFESLWLSGILFILVIIFSFIQYKLYIYIYPYQEKANALDSELGGLLSDDITNNHTIKIFASQKREEKQYAKLTNTTIQARKTQYFKSMWIWGSTGLFSIMLQIGVIYFAIRMWGQGLLSLGMIVLLQTYVLRIMDFLWGLGHTFRNVFKATSEAGEIIDIIQAPHEIKDYSNKKLSIKNGAITFDEVFFSYENTEKMTLKGLSFSVKPGEKIGLVGPSGAGKTSIIKLLMRFYDIQKGGIFIDGQDIKKVSQESLRESISLVPQEPILFHRTIKENIAYGKPDATDEEIIKASKMARCDRFIQKLEKKYDTMVGERGIKLSGGERQRVAIARAILENKSILLLDEATSALDSESELLIQEAMQEVMRNKTVIVIAHRLSTIMSMDRIIVLNNGEVVEQGSHKELMQKKNGHYAHLRDIQSGGFIE